MATVAADDQRVRRLTVGVREALHPDDPSIADRQEGNRTAPLSDERGRLVKLAAGRDLLDRPLVAVRIGEEHEPDVVEGIRLGGGILAHDLDLADLNPSLYELSTCRVKIGDDQLQTPEGTSRHFGDDSLSHDDRAAGSGRRELNHPTPLDDLGV